MSARLSPRFTILASLLIAINLSITGAPAQAADGKSAPAKKAAPIPAACQDKPGVEQKICVECDGLPLYKRIGCEQRVFWTTCKGMRLIKDPYCQIHKEGGPPAPVGG